jgi:hypothetical protein
VEIGDSAVIVVPSDVYKWSINPFTNPYPVYRHGYTVTIHICLKVPMDLTTFQVLRKFCAVICEIRLTGTRQSKQTERSYLRSEDYQD